MVKKSCFKIVFKMHVWSIRRLICRESSFHNEWVQQRLNVFDPLFSILLSQILQPLRFKVPLLSLSRARLSPWPIDILALHSNNFHSIIIEISRRDSHSFQVALISYKNILVPKMNKDLDIVCTFQFMVCNSAG